MLPFGSEIVNRQIAINNSSNEYEYTHALEFRVVLASNGITHCTYIQYHMQRNSTIFKRSRLIRSLFLNNYS